MIKLLDTLFDIFVMLINELKLTSIYEMLNIFFNLTQETHATDKFICKLIYDCFVRLLTDDSFILKNDVEDELVRNKIPLITLKIISNILYVDSLSIEVCI